MIMFNMDEDMMILIFSVYSEKLIFKVVFNKNMIVLMN